MKEGLTLSALAAEIERQNTVKRDFVADTRKASLSEDMKSVVLSNGSKGSLGTYPIREYAHSQIAEQLKLYRRDYDRLRTEVPDLYAQLVNGLFQRQPKERMFRTLDGELRAVVSNRYRRLDNYDLAKAVLPEIARMAQSTGAQVISSAFTETKLHLKVLFPKIEAKVPKVGDVVQSGLSISNSEVGDGRVVVDPLVYTLACLNGMIVPNYGLKKLHVGRKFDSTDEAYEILSDETRELDDAAFWSAVIDMVRAMSKPEVFEGIVAKLGEATEDKITADVPEVVELVGKKFGYTEATQAGILGHLIAGGDLTRYGMLNAITRQSQDEDDYETATKLENDGGRILELAPTEWQRIAERVKTKH